MQSTCISLSDIEEEMCPLEKSYTLLVLDQGKILHCTKLQVLPFSETEYPDSYAQVIRFSDNIDEDSEKVPGSKYHNQTLFRVLF
jgi:hypothetical protein